MFAPDCPGVLGSGKEGHHGASHGGKHDLCWGPSLLHHAPELQQLGAGDQGGGQDGRGEVHLCTVQTFPTESLIVFVRVDGTSNNQTGK